MAKGIDVPEELQGELKNILTQTADFKVGDKIKLSNGGEIEFLEKYSDEKVKETNRRGAYGYRPPDMAEAIVVENRNKKKMEEQKIMADETVTKYDLLRRDVEHTKEELGKKIEEREETDEEMGEKLAEHEKTDKEIQARLKQLDEKQCKGEECYTRIEKQQADILKMLEEKMQRLDSPLYVCSNCGIGTMRKGDPQCPHCGAKVKNWA